MPKPKRRHPEAATPPRGRNHIAFALLTVALALAAGWWFLRPGPGRGLAPGQKATDARAVQPPAEAVSSATCAECHKNFHELWAQSRHGLAMQPYTPDLGRRHLTAPAAPIRIADAVYTPDVGGAGAIREEGLRGRKDYAIAHVMGGKNVYYFLTPWERGRLQVLPLAYDVRRNAWFDTAASAVRHFGLATSQPADQPLDWRDPMYTFNTSCHSCHVSQLSTNYDAASDSYRTTWKEAGINCETCHGEPSEHVRLCRSLPPGQRPADPKIVSPRHFTIQQQNDACSGCHAKASPISRSYEPGGRFFDHYDLSVYEHGDYHPDGRDLGENYTLTSWRRSPCAKSGKLSCLHCHTSSGRYKFPPERANDACLPCHAERVARPAGHTRHKADQAGGRCVACHMPTTEFARMRRSDHSMLPPTPAATLAFNSPNACNLCHADKDAAWADRHVRQWHMRDYQVPVLRRGRLVEQARRGDWSAWKEMLAEIADPRRDEIVAASLVRLAAGNPDAARATDLAVTMKDPSPLVRASAAQALAARPDAQVLPALLAAAQDETRLVRIRSAAALAGWPLPSLPADQRPAVAAALRELEASLRIRPDDWASQYNLGNLLTDLGRLEEAVAAYAMASRCRSDAAEPLVNAAIAWARLGRSDQAEQALTRALALAPANAAAHFNLGLLRAEQGNAKAAEEHFRAALKTEPSMAQAAYNLGLLISKERPQEGLEWCRRAAQLRLDEPLYAYAVASLLAQAGRTGDAIASLKDLLARHADYADAYVLLGDLYVRNHQAAEAIALYRQAAARATLPPADRRALQTRADRLQSGGSGSSNSGVR